MDYIESCFEIVTSIFRNMPIYFDVFLVILFFCSKISIKVIVILLKTVLFCLRRCLDYNLKRYFKNNDNRNLPQKINISHEISIKFKCSVCFEIFDIDQGIIQCLPTSSNILNNDMVIDDSLSHSICITCLRGYAHSACTDIPVAFGGVGLKCAEHKCKNVFLLDTFESYLSEADSTLLKQRLQLQCLMDAGIEDIVTCSNCDQKFSVPNELKFFICHCGRIQCRSCPRAYDDEHIGKMCEEMDINKLNIKLSETVIRNCYKCGIAFIKEKGCNKMECRCGAKQCYICREKNINYNHFCSCFEPAEKHGKCPTCDKSCRIWENSEELDEIKINLLTGKSEPKNNSCGII